MPICACVCICVTLAVSLTKDVLRGNLIFVVATHAQPALLFIFPAALSTRCPVRAWQSD